MREKMRKIKRKKEENEKKGKALSFGEGIINQSPIKFALFFFLFSPSSSIVFISHLIFFEDAIQVNNNNGNDEDGFAALVFYSLRREREERKDGEKNVHVWANIISSRCIQNDLMRVEMTRMEIHLSFFLPFSSPSFFFSSLLFLISFCFISVCLRLHFFPSCFFFLRSLSLFFFFLSFSLFSDLCLLIIHIRLELLIIEFLP